MVRNNYDPCEFSSCLITDIVFCSATTDSKWYEWIEQHFNVASLKGRKITFEQFKETLQLEKVCNFKNKKRNIQHESF